MKLIKTCHKFRFSMISGTLWNFWTCRLNITIDKSHSFLVISAFLSQNLSHLQGWKSLTEILNQTIFTPLLQFRKTLLNSAPGAGGSGRQRASAERRRPPRPGFSNSLSPSCYVFLTPALYPRSLSTNHEGYGQKLGRPRRLWVRERRSKNFGTARTSTYWGGLIDELMR